ncbi:alpha/beta fold hydrolase [Bdellovibrionota bacterium]
MKKEGIIRGFYYLIEKILRFGGYKEEVVDLPDAEVHTLHYKNEKADIQMVLLHGIGTSSIQFCKILLPLRKKYEVWAPNLPTFINSSKVKGEHSYLTAAQQAELLAPWLQKLARNKPIVLVGISFGAWISLELALRYPEIVKKLVKINGAGISKGVEEARDHLASAKDNKETMKILFRLYTRWEKFFWMWAPFFKTVWMHPSVQQVLHNRENQLPLDDKMHLLKMPVKIIWGEEDQLLTKDVAEEFNRLIPDSKLCIIPSCGHSPPIERPDECVRELLEF